MPKNCSWGNCKSDSRRSDKLPDGIQWIPFPKPGKIRPGMTVLEKNKARLKTEKSKRWIYLCGRTDFNSVDQISRTRYICSLHFHSLSGPTDENPEPFHAKLSKKEQEIRSKRTKGGLIFYNSVRKNKDKASKDKQCVEVNKKKIKTDHLDLPSTSNPPPTIYILYGKVTYITFYV